MTHRTKHLARLGLIDRLKGDVDRRNVVCKITPEGEDYILDLCARTCEAIKTGRALSRISAERVMYYVDSMGTVSCMAGELVLLGISLSPEGGCTVTDLVDALGLLQPTVSMSISSLVEEDMAERYLVEDAVPRSYRIRLTERGGDLVANLTDQVSKIVVRRRPRTR